MYVIVDIETTGGNKKDGRITEIAAFLHDGSKVVDTFVSLVNPEQPIPSFISRLTGITNEMVSKAPLFSEIANQLNTFTANAIFVAHNVNFDYHFLREEFRRLGIEFQRKKLCTVQLSRSAFPGLESYSLDKITKELSIELDGHHRAAVDAEATVKLFEKILTKVSQQGLFDMHFGLPDLSKIASSFIDEDFLNSIPDDCGVFRIYDKEDSIIYVKRSQHLLSEICKKLGESETKLGQALIEKTYRIDYEITGSPLLAQLIEAHDVMKHKPEFNRGKFSMSVRFGAFVEEENEEIAIRLKRLKSNMDDPYFVFSNYYEGFYFLKDRARDAGLELYVEKENKRKEPSISLNGKSSDLEILEKIFPENPCFLIDEGRTASERVAVLFAGNRVFGYRYFDSDRGLDILNEEDLEVQFTQTPELELVVRRFIAKKRFEKLIPLKS